MRSSRRTHRRFVLGVPALLLGVCLLVAAGIAPLSLYFCRPMALGLSLQPHDCCAKNAGRDEARQAVVSDVSGCCEKIKDASPSVPALVAHPLTQLESPWAAALPPAEGQYSLEPVTWTRLLPPNRGPPAPPPSAPVYLRNASFLC